MSNMNSKKILICDDDEGVRESLKLILGDHYDLILTDSGEQCLDCLKNDKTVALVLLDMNMPRADEDDVLKAIKDRFPGINVIFINSKNANNTSQNSLSKAAGVLNKPFKSEEVLKAVKDLLKR